MGNISKIYPKNSMTCEEEQELIDLEKFMVDDLKMGI